MNLSVPLIFRNPIRPYRMRELIAPTTISNVSVSLQYQLAYERSQHDHLGHTFSTVRRYSCPAARAWVPSDELRTYFQYASGAVEVETRQSYSM